MENSSKNPTVKIILVIAIIAIVVFAAYAVFTYPKTVVDFPVSFSIGAETEERDFELSVLQSKVQVEIVINTGSTLWTASIIHQNVTIWDHRATQGGQTTYQSEWLELSSGQYNFTFTAAGFGELDANVKVIAKGGFW